MIFKNYFFIFLSLFPFHIQPIAIPAITEKNIIPAVVNPDISSPSNIDLNPSKSYNNITGLFPFHIQPIAIPAITEKNIIPAVVNPDISSPSNIDLNPSKSYNNITGLFKGGKMIKVKGLDKLQNKLKKASKQLKEMEGTKKVLLTDLLNENFLRKYTDFNTLDELFNKFSITSNEDIENNIEQLDNEVKANSNFSSWQEMLESATHYYFEKQLKNIFK